MNPVLILTHNNLELTKKCVDSVLAQDVETKVFIFDNGSTDGTQEWLPNRGLLYMLETTNTGVSNGWNISLEYLFDYGDSVLCINNDTILSKSLYSQLLSANVPFVSGSETTNLDDLSKEWPTLPLGGGPQFSCFLIRREAWKKIGPFDESMWGWASDCDYHVRAHRLGIPLLCSPARYYHERSSTINKADPKEKRNLQLQADADREAFEEKWRVPASGPGYDSLFSETLFGVDKDTI